jgi:hypothetical protein
VQGAVRSVSEDVASLRLEVAQAAKSSTPLSMAQHLQSSFQERQHRMEGALMQVGAHRWLRATGLVACRSKQHAAKAS